MSSSQRNEPNFFVIGAQKSGTSWLWSMLAQHPGASLPKGKEIDYFGSSELYARGDDWYLSHFLGLDSGKVIGEASTTYFYDRVPYWHNASRELKFDNALPTIPELILQKFPAARFVVTLRDPVHRAISAYMHYLRKGKLSPFLGLRKIATEQPKKRILEYGYYARYLSLWNRFVDPERLHVIIFEDDIKQKPEETVTALYRFLELDTSFKPVRLTRRVNPGWSWTHIVFNYYAGKLHKGIGRSRLGYAFERFDPLARSPVTRDDIEFLRSVYLPEKEQLIELTGNSLKYWDYGERLLQQL